MSKTGPHDQPKGQGKRVSSMLPGPGQLSKVWYDDDDEESDDSIPSAGQAARQGPQAL